MAGLAEPAGKSQQVFAVATNQPSKAQQTASEQRQHARLGGCGDSVEQYICIRVTPHEVEGGNAQDLRSACKGHGNVRRQRTIPAGDAASTQGPDRVALADLVSLSLPPLAFSF